MAYITYEDYREYLGGIEPTIPETEFNYWARKVSNIINTETYGRLADSQILEKYKSCIKDTACELIEHTYKNKSLEGKGAVRSESFQNYSVSYGDPQNANPAETILAGLDICGGISTGLRYRGIYCKQKNCCDCRCR